MTKLPILLVAAALAVVSITSQAEDAPRRMNPQERMEHMKKTLDLTPEQETKIKEIYANNRDKVKKAREEGKGMEAYKAVNDEVMAVLTPEQQGKWKEEQKKARAGAARKKDK